MNNVNQLSVREKVERMNRYYTLTEFYSFLKRIALKGLWLTLFFVGSILLIDNFIVDIEKLLTLFVENSNAIFVLIVFYVSETFLGLLPPEVFIAWTSKMSNPWLMLFITATLSYAGGITAYFIGRRLRKIPIIHDRIKFHIAKHLINLRKWGGFLVVVGAMLPIPHSIISMSSGFIDFKFKHYILWALFRYLRFFIFGLVIFRIL